MDLKKLTEYKNIQSRAICMENLTGEKNKGNLATEGANAQPSYAGGLGKGWKISPCVFIKPHTTFKLCDINGCGHINHIWMTTDSFNYSSLIFRGGFDNQKNINSPIGAFFLNGWGRRNNVTSLPICVNPSGGFNCYFSMPFRHRAVLEIENVSDHDAVLYFQIDFSFDEVLENEMYFNALYKQEESLPKKTYYQLLNVECSGCYVGTYFGFKTDAILWWGEGEFLFYIDDDEHPTICTTGTEDYFGGAWNFEQPSGKYCKFSSPYSGLIDVYPEDQIYVEKQEFGLYRFHINDPIFFHKNIKVEVEAIGWEKENFPSIYRSLSPKLISVAYWYSK